METAAPASDVQQAIDLAEPGQPPAVDVDELPALLEALLLVAPEPADVRDLARTAGRTVVEIEEALTSLERESARGWVIVRHRGTAHLASNPRFAPHVRRFLRLEREARLSGAALETLALIAYHQPVTRAEIESLRGVDCTGVLATLHSRGLIEIAGRLATVGNPNQYVTSVDFLRQFGFRSLEELPPIDGVAGGDAELLLKEVSTIARVDHRDAGSGDEAD
jgi:segregation and condensation protein B